MYSNPWALWIETAYGYYRFWRVLVVVRAIQSVDLEANYGISVLIVTPYHVPGLVYVAGESSLHVFAYRGATLKPDSVLYWGPFFNTTQGNVCLGTAKIRKPLNPTYAELAEYWEKRFWCTEFTHLGHGGNPTKNNLALVTKAAAEKPFDEKELVSSGKKLKDLLL